MQRDRYTEKKKSKRQTVNKANTTTNKHHTHKAKITQNTFHETCWPLDEKKGGRERVRVSGSFVGTVKDVFVLEKR